MERFKSFIREDENEEKPKAKKPGILKKIGKAAKKVAKTVAASNASVKAAQHSNRVGGQSTVQRHRSSVASAMSSDHADAMRADKITRRQWSQDVRREEVELDEAKTGMFGGKYTSKDHMLGMKNMQSIRKKRQDQRNAEHQKQDPKMAKMGYAKHMLDTDKADAKARKRGIDPTGKYDKYKKRNNIKESVERWKINKYYDSGNHEDAGHAHHEAARAYKASKKKGAAEVAKHHMKASDAHEKAHELIGKGHYDAAHSMSRTATQHARDAYDTSRKHGFDSTTNLGQSYTKAAYDDSRDVHKHHSYLRESVEVNEGILGATAGGAAGFAVGGPIGALTGAGLGHEFEKGARKGYKKVRRKKIDEISKEKLADYATKAIQDRDAARLSRDKYKSSAAANRFRGDDDAAKADDRRASDAENRIARRDRGGKNYTRKMLTKED